MHHVIAQQRHSENGRRHRAAGLDGILDPPVEGGLASLKLKGVCAESAKPYPIEIPPRWLEGPLRRLQVQ